MGSRLVNFSFTPGENEQIETVIKLPEEYRSVIHGIVKNHCNKLVKDAVVKLFECVNNDDVHSLKPLTHTFTDEFGEFIFGPLSAYKSYAIKVWVNDVKIRELIVRPEECSYTEIRQHCKKTPKPCEKEKEKESAEDQVVQSYGAENTLDCIDE